MTETKVNKQLDLANIFNKFLKKTNLSDKYFEKTKEFIQDKDLDYIIINYTKIEKTWSENPIELDSDLLKEKFYESVGEYILEGNYDVLNEKHSIILLFTHIKPKLIYTIIKYVYPLSDKSIKSIYNYRYIVSIYLILEVKPQIVKFLENKDYEGLGLITTEYYELANKLIEDGIILNTLYPKLNESSHYKNLSIYDLFVHSSYVTENFHTSLLWLKIIFNQLVNLSPDEYFIFNDLPVNIKSLELLTQIVSDKNSKTIDHIIDESDTNTSDYFNKFIYYLNKLYYYMKKRSVLDKYILNFKKLDYYIDYYYTQIFASRPNDIIKLDNINVNDNVNFIFDTVTIGHNELTKFFIKCFEQSIDLIAIEKIYIIMIWTRRIYHKLGKYNSIVSYNIKSNEYSVKIGIKYQVISREEYLSDIQLYLDEVDVYISDFIIGNIQNFIEKDYLEIKALESVNKFKKCAVCLDQVEIPSDRIVCIGCKNIFHETCINHLFEQGFNNCPICDEPILSVLLTFSEIKYNFFNDILIGYKNKK